ncbi:22075_t:CDS:1, partial [Dentiscutata erythropus]
MRRKYIQTPGSLTDTRNMPPTTGNLTNPHLRFSHAPQPGTVTHIHLSPTPTNTHHINLSPTP